MFLTYEVKVGLPPQRVRDEADHAVQRQAALDDGAGLAQRAHVRVHGRVHQPERDGLVAHQRLSTGISDQWFWSIMANKRMFRLMVIA